MKRYDTPKEVRRLSNRHLVKCYKIDDSYKRSVEEFKTKLKYYKKIAKQQQQLLEWASSAIQPQEVKVPETQQSCNLELISPNRWNAQCTPEFELPKSSKATPKPVSSELYENSLYIKHHLKYETS